MSSATMELLKKSQSTPVAKVEEVVTEKAAPVEVKVAKALKIVKAPKIAKESETSKEVVENTTSQEVAETKTTPKSETKLPAKKTLDGEILKADLIANTAYELENIDQPTKAANMVKDLLEQDDFNEFKLGGLLTVIKDKGWIAEYPNFRQFIEAEFGLAYRKAMYCMALYRDLVESGVLWDQVKHLGWTKLKELAPFLKPDNAPKLIAKAEQLTVLQLIEFLAKMSAGTALKGTEQDEPTTATMTFKVHKDQRETIAEALTKAKKQGKTDVATVALELICLDYLGGGGKVVLPEITVEVMGEAMKKIGINKTLEAFEKVWPEIEMTVKVPEELEEGEAEASAGQDATDGSSDEGSQSDEADAGGTIE